jgi:hypothetical protein
MQKYVKFTGKFTDLIPNGWEFQKLFANNYRQYSKTCDGSKYGQGCSIWQHLGGYLEIDDFFSNSHIIVDKVASGKIGEWISQIKHREWDDTNKKWFIDGTEDVCWTLFDTQDKVFYPQHSPEYFQLCGLKYTKYDELKSGKITDAEFDKCMGEYFHRYQERNFDLKLFKMIQDLLDKGWIEVVDDNRKR